MTELHIQLEGYRITRSADAACRDGQARYTVTRPDGTTCCSGAEWADVERVIDRDRKDRDEAKRKPE